MVDVDVDVVVVVVGDVVLVDEEVLVLVGVVLLVEDVVVVVDGVVVDVPDGNVVVLVVTPHTGSSVQSESAQSTSPSPSLSVWSPHSVSRPVTISPKMASPNRPVAVPALKWVRTSPLATSNRNTSPLTSATQNDLPSGSKLIDCAEASPTAV